MIYNAQQFGDNILIINEEIPLDQYILAVLYIPCNNDSINVNGNKKSVLDINYCNGMNEVNFEGVDSFYEDLLSGLIAFTSLGTWNVNLYYQDNNTNTDVSLATFIKKIQLQVIN